jgi:hypothetical protein
MSKWVKKVTAGLVAALLAGSFAFFHSNVQTVHAAMDNEASVPKVQLISNQRSVGAEGFISYHILYDQVQAEGVAGTWLKVKVPEGLEADEANLDGGVWEEENRTVTWDLTDLLEGSNTVNIGSGVLHFNLNVKGDAALGSAYDVSAILEQDGKVVFESPTVKVLAGPEIHQPFFIGYPDGKFHPKSFITRAETAAVVARVKNLEDTASNVEYSDVPANHWAYEKIHQVSKAGYMEGYDGQFYPDQPISRAELVVLALRMRGIEQIALKPFDDTENHWAAEEIATAKALGFITGIDDKTFGPDSYTERQVAAQLFSVALYRGPLLDGDIPVKQHFPDVDQDDWAFPWVEEVSVEAHESIHKGDGEHLIRYLPDQTRSF